jgi:REP element-mobilizing transposase RayT
MRQRKIIRLKGYDYSIDGWYFVTIVVQDRLHLFGEIKENSMILNNAGKMIIKWYNKLEIKFPGIKCHENIVMPNHFHCIIEIRANVGSAPCVRPSLSQIIQWFKTMTTNEYIKGVKGMGWRKFNKKLWERSFIDRILREHEIERTKTYILNNPKNPN